MAQRALEDVRLSEVIGSLSYALDITEGQPMGHAARSCAIGMRIAAVIGLPAEQRTSLYYALLLKDAGCSTNASKVAELYGADDREVKRRRKLLDQHDPRELAAHLWRDSAPGGGPVAKAGRVAALVRHGAEGSRRLTELRCERGAEIARIVGVGDEAAAAIHALDEHWDGSGHPDHRAGEAIPLLGRILGLSQTVEVFHNLNGASYACAMARTRAGTWFDPALVQALTSFEGDDPFWRRLAEEEEPARLVAEWEPEEEPQRADDERLDRIAEAFARVADAKSPFTLRHSEEVARLAAGTARRLGWEDGAVRDLRRAALLHDVGTLGVSNTILDKPGRLRPDEWAQMRRHPEYTFRILAQVPAFRKIAPVAAAHHERLDGSGYHLGLTAARLSQGARILAIADVCEALSAERSYRGAMTPEDALRTLRADVPGKLDAEAFEALREHLDTT